MKTISISRFDHYCSSRLSLQFEERISGSTAKSSLPQYGGAVQVMPFLISYYKVRKRRVVYSILKAGSGQPWPIYCIKSN